MALITDFIQADKITELATALISRKTVFNSITDVKMGFKGSSAPIPILNSGTTGDYVPGTDMTVNNVSSSNIIINLDQSKYINDYLDDVDEASAAQSALPQLLNTLTTNMANLVDQYVLQELWDTATTTDAALGASLTPIAIDEDNIDDYLSTIDRLLTEADAPEDGRYAIITPKMQQALTLNNVYVAASTDEMARTRGYRGMYSGLEIYVSNNLKEGAFTGNNHDLAAAEVGVIGGIKGAGNTLFNYEKFRSVEAEDRFGQKYQAVANYGAGANTPAWIVWGVVAK